VRTLTAQESALLALGAWSTHVRVEIDRDGAGTYQDLTNLVGFDWLVSAELRENVDDPVASSTVTLEREMQPLGGVWSLSPFVRASPLNIVGGVYTPMIDIGRRLKISTAMMPLMMSPSAADWRLVFDGYIDSLDMGGESLKLECRDLGARLQDAFIETDDVYGSDAGTSVEGQMQAIIDATIGTSVVTLYTPSSPGWNVHKWMQERTFVGDAVRKLAQQIGWDARYKWDSGAGAFHYTFWTPDRAKTTPDLTLGSSQYVALPRVGLAISGIRNAITVQYTARSPVGEGRATTTDSTSITRYRRRPMIVGEASTSNIDSSTEATAFSNAMLSDLKDPVIEQTAETPYIYNVEIGDLVRFSANGTHFDVDTDLAITTINHSLTKDSAKTTLGLRGKPSGGWDRWLALDIRTGISTRKFASAKGSNTLIDAPAVVTSGTWVLGFDTAIIDEAGLVDATNKAIKIVETGVYDVTCHYRWRAGQASGKTASYVHYVYANGQNLELGRVEYPNMGANQYPCDGGAQNFFDFTWRGILFGGDSIQAKIGVTWSPAALNAWTFAFDGTVNSFLSINRVR